MEVRLEGSEGQAAAQEVLERARSVRLILFDIDGVFTDGSLLLLDNGVEGKVFNVRDGLGLVMLLEAGIEVGVISGRNSPVVAERMGELGVRHIHQGKSRKLPVFESILAELSLQPEQAAYMGDDLPDLPVLRRAGLALTVADADPRVLAEAHWCSSRPGGRGAVREACELILEAQGHLRRLAGGHGA
ncbi:MAG: 3-deoxy-D-manno-octulosonate 8-phosphate phosphatase [Gammaproteobacteria bacterium]|nr:MAG: 3-deoxy-D-manno-octulosonate 8-phosphate phosphatase [Gammaproteobacteria bacterium]